jgi:hypothetical protein
MLYRITIVIGRYSDREPAGVTSITVVREIQATSWANAVSVATASVLADATTLLGGLPGTSILSVHAEVL